MGGFVGALGANPVGNNVSMAQANNELNAARSFLPGPQADALGLGQQIANWSNEVDAAGNLVNPDTFQDPAFTNARNFLFGPGQTQISGPSSQYGLDKIGGGNGNAVFNGGQGFAGGGNTKKAQLIQAIINLLA